MPLSLEQRVEQHLQLGAALQSAGVEGSGLASRPAHIDELVTAAESLANTGDYHAALTELVLARATAVTALQAIGDALAAIAGERGFDTTTPAGRQALSAFVSTPQGWTELESTIGVSTVASFDESLAVFNATFARTAGGDEALVAVAAQSVYATEEQLTDLAAQLPATVATLEARKAAIEQLRASSTCTCRRVGSSRTSAAGCWLEPQSGPACRCAPRFGVSIIPWGRMSSSSGR